MMGRILKPSDWPFLVKVALAPMLALLLTVVIALLGVRGLKVESSAVQNALNSAATSHELEEITGGVRSINENLYHVLTLQAAQTEGLKAVDELQAQAESVDRVVNQLRVWRDKRATVDEKPRVDKLIAGVEKYKGAISWVSQMLDVDFSAAVSFLKPFDANFEELTKGIADLLNEQMKAQQLEADNATTTAEAAKHGFIFTTSASLVLCLVLTGAMSWTTICAVNAIAAAIMRLAAGDTETDLTVLVRQDELGAIVKAVIQFRDALLRIAAQRKAQEQEAEKERQEALRLMEEQKRQEADELRRSALGNLVNSFEGSVGAIVHDVAAAALQMQGVAQSMSDTASSTIAQATSVTDAAQDAGRSVSKVAEAAEQLSTSIAEISRQAQGASKVALSAVATARRTSDTVQALSDAGAKIGEVIELISTIAAQTNMLALNATVEAARAGESGKGFAVVASEVRRLAGQTRLATDDISKHVTQIQNATREAVAAIREIETTIEDVSRIGGVIAAAVVEQGAATTEIARSVQETSVSTTHVTATIVQVSAAVKNTGSAAAQAFEAARSLALQAEELELQVDTFVGEVRAA